jgi:hypothetical protein
MMDARKLLINLLYRAVAQSSEIPGWSHRQTKNRDAADELHPGFSLNTLGLPSRPTRE